MKNERIDRDIVWNVGLMRADDSTGNLEDFILNVVQDQFLVLAFCRFTNEFEPNGHPDKVVCAGRMGRSAVKSESRSALCNDTCAVRQRGEQSPIR